MRDIAYDVSAGGRGRGDLFLPSGGVGGAPVLLIHGGGWNALSKEFIEFLVPLFSKNRRAVFSVNYRLLDEAPWPACGDDCLAAARHVLGGRLGEHGLPAPESLMLCGASAGAHLAMMTALRLPRQQVEAIVSLAGPTRMDWVATGGDPQGLHEGLLERFFGRAVEVDGPEVRAASPALLVDGDAPPLYCLHSRNDRLVPPIHSAEAVSAWRAGGGRAELVEFDGDGQLHGFWVDDDREAGRLRPEVAGFIDHVFETLAPPR